MSRPIFPLNFTFFFFLFSIHRHWLDQPVCSARNEIRTAGKRQNAFRHADDVLPEEDGSLVGVHWHAHESRRYRKRTVRIWTWFSLSLFSFPALAMGILHTMMLCRRVVISPRPPLCIYTQWLIFPNDNSWSPPLVPSLHPLSVLFLLLFPPYVPVRRISMYWGKEDCCCCCSRPGRVSVRDSMGRAEVVVVVMLAAVGSSLRFGVTQTEQSIGERVARPVLQVVCYSASHLRREDVKPFEKCHPTPFLVPPNTHLTSLLSKASHTDGPSHVSSPLNLGWAFFLYISKSLFKEEREGESKKEEVS